MTDPSSEAPLYKLSSDAQDPSHAVNRPRIIDHLAAQVAAIERAHPTRVAIDGIDAAGKTTFADELGLALAARGRAILRASIDDFHNPAEARYRRGRLSPEGYFHDAFDYARLNEALLDPLSFGGSLEFRRAIFDFRSDQPVDAPLERTTPDSILVFDGVFLLRPELRARWDFSIFLRIDFEMALARALKRGAQSFDSADELEQRYRTRYFPAQRLYFADAEPERWASVVVESER